MNNNILTVVSSSVEVALNEGDFIQEIKHISAHAEAFLTEQKEITPDNLTRFEKGAEVLRDTRLKVEKTLDAIKRPLNDARNIVLDKEKELKRPLQALEDGFVARLSNYKTRLRNEQIIIVKADSVNNRLSPIIVEYNVVLGSVDTTINDLITQFSNLYSAILATPADDLLSKLSKLAGEIKERIDEFKSKKFENELPVIEKSEDNKDFNSFINDFNGDLEPQVILQPKTDIIDINGSATKVKLKKELVIDISNAIVHSYVAYQGDDFTKDLIKKYYKGTGLTPEGVVIKEIEVVAK